MINMSKIWIEADAILLRSHEETLSALAFFLKDMLDHDEVKGFEEAKLKGVYHILVSVQDELGDMADRLEGLLQELAQEKAGKSLRISPVEPLH